MLGLGSLATGKSPNPQAGKPALRAWTFLSASSGGFPVPRLRTVSSCTLVGSGRGLFGPCAPVWLFGIENRNPASQRHSDGPCRERFDPATSVRRVFGVDGIDFIR